MRQIVGDTLPTVAPEGASQPDVNEHVVPRHYPHLPARIGAWREFRLA